MKCCKISFPKEDAEPLKILKPKLHSASRPLSFGSREVDSDAVCVRFAACALVYVSRLSVAVAVAVACAGAGDVKIAASCAEGGFEVNDPAAPQFGFAVLALLLTLSSSLRLIVAMCNLRRCFGGLGIDIGEEHAHCDVV